MPRRRKKNSRQKFRENEVYNDWDQLLGLLLRTDEARYGKDITGECKGGWSVQQVVYGRPHPPEILFGLSSRTDDRLFSFDESELILPAAAPLMDKAGIAFLTPDSLQIVGWRKSGHKELPKTVRSFGRKRPYVELSCYSFYDKVCEGDVKYYAGTRKGFVELRAKNPGVSGKLDDLDEQFVVYSSIIEDMFCTGFVALQNIHHKTTGVFAADAEARKAIEDLRTSPTAGAGSRRSPIRHWVREHVRRVQARETEVEGHTRGITFFPVANWRVLSFPSFASIWGREGEKAKRDAGEALAYLGVRPWHDVRKAGEPAVDQIGEPEELLGRMYGETVDPMIRSWFLAGVALDRHSIRTLDDAMKDREKHGQRAYVQEKKR